MTDATMEELSGALKLVGFRSDGEAAITKNITARRWASTYAQVYVVDIPKGSVSEWSTLLTDIDHEVLNALRADELKNGGVMDAHVCFLIDDLGRRDIEGHVDERTSRNVSRKYWIGRAEGFGGFQARLSLLSIGHVTALAPKTSFGISANDQKWVDMLVDEGPDTVFRRLLSETGCG